MTEACKSDLIDLTLVIHMKTDRAIRVSETGDDAKAVWLPVAHCEIAPKGRQAVIGSLLRKG